MKPAGDDFDGAGLLPKDQAVGLGDAP